MTPAEIDGEAANIFARRRMWERGLTGKPWDPELGLYWFGYRWYSPALRRWTQQEPLGLDGPNLYHYVRGNPIRYVDPIGLETEPADGCRVSRDLVDKYCTRACAGLPQELQPDCRLSCGVQIQDGSLTGQSLEVILGMLDSSDAGTPWGGNCHGFCLTVHGVPLEGAGRSASAEILLSNAVRLDDVNELRSGDLLVIWPTARRDLRPAATGLPPGNPQHSVVYMFTYPDGSMNYVEVNGYSRPPGGMHQTERDGRIRQTRDDPVRGPGQSTRHYLPFRVDVASTTTESASGSP